MFRFTLREPDRGRGRFRSRSWWLSVSMPRPWRRCSEECRVGTEYEHDGRVYRRDHREIRDI